ncbi:MAG: acyl--CoA ligase [Sphingomonadales bacterium]|nr:acyl--CoA ligase [Sphingomonadales bacterium]
MIEPWDRDWHGLADWTTLPRIAPTIPALLAHAKASHPDRDVLVLDEQRTTYGEVEARSALFARQLLAAGIGKGSHVGVMLPNDESFLISWLGVTRIGAIAITLPSLATPSEIARVARHADLQLLIAPRRYLHHDYAARLAEALPVALDGSEVSHWLTDFPHLRMVWLWCGLADDCPAWARRIDLKAACEAGPELLAAAEGSVHSSDPAGIIYTSGSTAEPKGVIHSQGNFVRQGLKLAASFGYTAEERAFASMPFFWVGGLVTTALCLMTAGGTILASRKTGAELLDFIEAQRTTAVVTWPHILRQLADDPTFPGRRWSAMRSGLFYEALPPDRRPADPSLMATPIGMTETCGPYTIIDRHLGEEQRGSLGVLMPGLEARLLDPETGAVLGEWRHDGLQADSAGQIGVLHLRSDVMMLGMVKREHSEIFTADGWYPTGDLVSFRAGHFHYHSRADDLIKAHGANVSPREVEAVIAKLPGVAAVHAVGVPDARRGTVVGAVVVPESGCVPSVETIREECSRLLASYKVPRIIAIRAASELPVLASSKIDRRGLVRLLEELTTA